MTRMGNESGYLQQKGICPPPFSKAHRLSILRMDLSKLTVYQEGGENLKKVYVDSDGSKYCDNHKALMLCAEHIENEGDTYWNICMGLIADWNTSRRALGMTSIKNPKNYLRKIAKSCLQ